MKRVLSGFFHLLIIINLTACALFQPAPSGLSTMSAVGVGAGVGAGAGALIGSAISNGDVLASAGLGAGLGVATVVGTRYAVRKYQENKVIKGNNLTIAKNYDQLKSQREQIDTYYDSVHSNVNDLTPTEEENRYFEGVVQ